MNDMPIQTVLQQLDAKPVSGEHLEVLGKTAAKAWGRGDYDTLSDAVAGTVRDERLSPEQVRRVVEFCNGDAYLAEFRKESSHKVVNFSGGPADPSLVLQDLNDGGGGTVYDSGDGDYRLSVDGAMKKSASFEKTASGRDLSCYEDEFWALFATGGEEKIAYADPLKELRDLGTKLAGTCAHLSSDIDSLEAEIAGLKEELYGHVKQAALNDVPLGDVVVALSSVSDDPEILKAAFAYLSPKLFADGVFTSRDALGASIEKTAAHGEVNTQHPLVEVYGDLCAMLHKLAATRELRAEFELGAKQATALWKQAELGGAVGAGLRGIRAASGKIDRWSPAVAKALVGQEAAGKVAPVIALGTKGVGLAGAGLAGNAAVQEVTDRPTVRGALGAAKSLVPGTQEYNLRRYNLMTGQ